MEVAFASDANGSVAVCLRGTHACGMPPVLTASSGHAARVNVTVCDPGPMIEVGSFATLAEAGRAATRWFEGAIKLGKIPLPARPN